MKHERLVAARCSPAHRIAVRCAPAAISAPEDDERQGEAGGQRGQRGRMPERVGAIQHRRRCRAKPAQESAAGEQIPNHRFAARNQLVSEDVPGPRLESPVSQRGAEDRGAVGAHRQIVFDDDRLTVEQKGFPARDAVEQLVDERHESLPEAFRRLVPFAVPVRVRDDVDVERHSDGRADCIVRGRR